MPLRKFFTQGESVSASTNTNGCLILTSLLLSGSEAVSSTQPTLSTYLRIGAIMTSALAIPNFIAFFTRKSKERVQINPVNGLNLFGTATFIAGDTFLAFRDVLFRVMPDPYNFIPAGLAIGTGLAATLAALLLDKRDQR